MKSYSVELYFDYYEGFGPTIIDEDVKANSLQQTIDIVFAREILNGEKHLAYQYIGKALNHRTILIFK